MPKNYDSVNADLAGYADSYVEDCASERVSANESIYNLCVDYYFRPITQKERDRLINFFLNR